MNLLAIDPGPELTGYCVLDANTYRPLRFGKIPSEQMIDQELLDIIMSGTEAVVIEKVASYGMSVGQSVHDTSWWSGRFYEAARRYARAVEMMYRREVKLNLCCIASARDANIIQALIDRFDPYASNHGKGTKKQPGWFYGFRADVWQAYALGVTAVDKGLFPR